MPGIQAGLQENWATARLLGKPLSGFRFLQFQTVGILRNIVRRPANEVKQNIFGLIRGNNGIKASRIVRLHPPCKGGAGQSAGYKDAQRLGRGRSVNTRIVLRFEPKRRTRNCGLGDPPPKEPQSGDPNRLIFARRQEPQFRRATDCWESRVMLQTENSQPKVCQRKPSSTIGNTFS